MLKHLEKISVEPLMCAFFNLPHRENMYEIRSEDEMHEIMLGAAPHIRQRGRSPTVTLTAHDDAALCTSAAIQPTHCR